jgi:hypothetical protein
MKKEQHTLCWGCANACGNCAWSRSFQPVPGWEAKPTKINNNALRYDGRYTPSFLVISCPEFENG